MTTNDDELIRFEEQGAMPFPKTDNQGYIEHDGAIIWYAVYGRGKPVILLHGGLGNSGNWGYQIPALLAEGYQAIVIDSRGHGRSTRDKRPYSYELMASDVIAVMETLLIQSASLVGWSDGAVIALIIGEHYPERVNGVLFFACNVDPSGAKEITEFPIALQNCFSRHIKDYQNLSTTPDQFEPFMEDIGLMQRTQPNYSTADLQKIHVPVQVVLGEHDEFIKKEHAVYLANSIPNAAFLEIPQVSHFAPLQRPDQFNRILLDFLNQMEN
jgi:pimeloyl-ACP methyl ester carboxylesterase